MLLGFLIYVFALAVLRSPRFALGAVLLIQVLNEVNDYQVKDASPLYKVTTAVVDTAATILLPLAIGIFAGRMGRSPSSPDRAAMQDQNR